MAFNRNHARPLCSDAEYKLFTASLGDEICDLTPAQLRSKIQRTRRLRDKYRDLLKRQRLANRARTGTKKGDRPATNTRTADKAKLFDEALGRFEARHEKLAAAAERDAARKAAKAALAARSAERKNAAKTRAANAVKGKGKGKGRASGAAPAGYASESARVAARGKLARDVRAGARKGHKSAAGKRTQAKRDRRS
jgi:hypothetical protein